MKITGRVPRRDGQFIRAVYPLREAQELPFI